MGGGGKSSGMASSNISSGEAAARSVFRVSADEAARNYFDALRINPGEKYHQVEAAAEGKLLGYHSSDVIRTQAEAPELLNGRGKNATWKEGYNEILNERLGESGRNALNAAIQRQAQKWLDRNPRPAHPRKDGWKWDGTKYVKK